SAYARSASQHGGAPGDSEGAFGLRVRRGKRSRDSGGQFPRGEGPFRRDPGQLSRRIGGGRESDRTRGGDQRRDGRDRIGLEGHRGLDAAPARPELENRRIGQGAPRERRRLQDRGARVEIAQAIRYHLCKYSAHGGSMRRKVLALALALTLVTAFGASAYTAAVGGEFAFSGLGNGLPGSAAFITFRLPKLPAVFGIGGTIASSGGQSSLGLMADWWLAQGKLVRFVDYYVGPGLFADFSSAGTNAGIRV